MSFDMAVYTLTCKNCGATEDSTIRDHGSVWSGCDWDSSASFSRFRECPAYTLLYQFFPKDTGKSKVK